MLSVAFCLVWDRAACSVQSPAETRLTNLWAPGPFLSPLPTFLRWHRGCLCSAAGFCGSSWFQTWLLMLGWQALSPQLLAILPERKYEAHLKLCVLVSWLILNFMVQASVSSGEGKIRQNKLHSSMMLCSFLSFFLHLRLQLGHCCFLDLPDSAGWLWSFPLPCSLFNFLSYNTASCLTIFIIFSHVNRYACSFLSNLLLFLSIEYFLFKRTVCVAITSHF